MAKVILRPDETLEQALLRFQKQCKREGIVARHQTDAELHKAVRAPEKRQIAAKDDRNGETI